MTNAWIKNEGTCPVHQNRMGDNIEIKLLGVSEPRIRRPHDVIWEQSGKSGDLLEWRFVEPLTN